MQKNELVPAKNEIVVYQPNETLRLEVLLRQDTVWLNRQQIANLFGRDVKTIGKHIANALKEELAPDVSDFGTTQPAGLGSTVAKFATVQNEGLREVVRQVEYYNLEMITSIGYRVKSPKGVLFRRWCCFAATSAGSDLPYGRGTFDVGEGTMVGRGSGSPDSDDLIVLCGGGGAIRIGGAADFSNITYEYFASGGGTVEIYGENPSLVVHHSFRSKWASSNTIDSNLRFVVPASGWAGRTTPCVDVKGDMPNAKDHSGVLGGSDAEVAASAPGLSTKLRVSVDRESPVFEAGLRSARGKVLLVKAGKGINTNRVELVEPERKNVSLYYTWSEDPNDTAGAGLPKCIWLSNMYSNQGTFLFVR